jgi:hypothetical protein
MRCLRWGGSTAGVCNGLTGQDVSYEDVSVGDDLSQGDVLLWRGATDPMATAAIVVTADCDLARGKHWGRVSVVPLLSLETCVDELLAPKLLASLSDRLWERLSKEVHAALKLAETDPLPTRDVLELQLFGNDLPAQFESTQMLKPLVAVLRQIRKQAFPYSPVDALAEAFNILEPKAKGIVANRIKSSLSTLPGDLIMLPSLPHMPWKTSVAWVRALREVQESAIVRRASEANDGDAIRVCRLAPAIRYRLTQQLGQVFADIGLSSAHENLAKEQVYAFCLSLAQKYGQ